LLDDAGFTLLPWRSNYMHHIRNARRYLRAGVLMNCNLSNIDGVVYACTNAGCGRVLKIERRKKSSLTFQCAGTAVGESPAEEVIELAKKFAACHVILGGLPIGPGTQLREMLAEMGFAPKGCACQTTEAKMNGLGPDGCREQLDALCGEIIRNAKKWGLAIPKGFDPLPYVRELVEMAIERAEQAASAKTDAQDAASRDASGAGVSKVVEA